MVFLGKHIQPTWLLLIVRLSEQLVLRDSFTSVLNSHKHLSYVDIDDEIFCYMISNSVVYTYRYGKYLD